MLVRCGLSPPVLVILIYKMSYIFIVYWKNLLMIHFSVHTLKLLSNSVAPK